MSVQDTYRGIDGVNFSTLKAMADSPRHYFYRVSNPLEDTPRLTLGRAAHTAVFEPDRFLLDYAVFDGERRAGEAWKTCVAANPGKTILRADEYLTCLRMREAVRSHPVAGPALQPPGEAEKILTWTDEATGLPCKARLDWYRPGLLADLKTTQTVDAFRFGALAARMLYHGQMVFYRDALRANGLDAPVPRIIAVEATEPHDVAVFVLEQDAIEAGEALVADLMAKVAAGRFSGQWPGRHPEEVPLRLPRWALPEDDDDVLNGLVIGGAA